MRNYIWVLGIILGLITGCARVGMPSGGEKDTTPPKLLQSIPASGTVNFKGHEIVLQFDEYVTLKDAIKNILISPPLQQMPVVKPAGIAAKTLKLEFKEDLLPNTTYIINFGESISDFNEGNKLKSLQLVFATGPVIDSLTLKGKIKPVYFTQKPKDILVGLYPVANFKDSLVFTQKPYYVALADKNGQYRFTHLKKGKYFIRAIEDKNRNFKYSPGEEAIAFSLDTLQIPRDTLVDLVLFQEPKRPKIEKIKQVSAHHIQIAYEGVRDSIRIVPVKPLTQSYIMGGDKQIDYWYDTPQDSIYLKIYAGQKLKKYLKKRVDIPDSLLVRIQGKGRITPLDTVRISGNRPLLAVDSNKIQLISDSLTVPFQLVAGENYSFDLVFDKQPGKSYSLQVLPQAVTGYLKTQNKDTLRARLSIPALEKYGTLQVQFDSLHQPAFVELLQKDKVFYKTPTKTTGTFKFAYLMPGKYKLRLVYDANNNNKWDTGNYLQHLQPEKTFEPDMPIEIRANWEVNQKFSSGN